MGRKTKLTPELQSDICKLVASSVPLPDASVHAGVSWNTVKDWMAKGRAGKRPYVEFVEAIDAARASWKVGAVLTVTKQAKKDAKWAAWLLERRHREFAPPTQRVDVEARSTEWLRTIIAQVRSRASKGEFDHLTKEAVDELLAVFAGRK